MVIVFRQNRETLWPKQWSYDQDNFLVMVLFGTNHCNRVSLCTKMHGSLEYSFVVANKNIHMKVEGINVIDIEMYVTCTCICGYVCVNTYL